MLIHNRKVSLSSIAIFIVCLLFFTIFTYFYAHVERTDRLYVQDQTNVDTTGEITKDRLLEQSFIAPYDGLMAINVVFGTYGRSNTTQYVIELFDENSLLISEFTVNSADLVDNESLTIHFDKIIKSKGKVYCLRMTSPDARIGNAVAIYTYPAVDQQWQLLVDGEDTGKSLALSCAYQFFDIQTVFVLIYFALVISGFIIYIYKFI